MRTVGAVPGGRPPVVKYVYVTYSGPVRDVKPW
jgi:hypothetical protein